MTWGPQDEIFPWDGCYADEPTYKIVRFRFQGDSEIMQTGLSLEEAQAHCQREDTHGEGWFDGYVERKREKLAHPETYVVREGFGDEHRERGLVEVWWWDRYHQNFGPSLMPMPWLDKTGGT